MSIMSIDEIILEMKPIPLSSIDSIPVRAERMRDLIMCENDKFESNDSAPRKDGYVYLIGCGGYTKIGFTENMKQRFDSIRTSSPGAYIIYYGKAQSDLERLLQADFIESHYDGEWFKLNQRQVDFCIEQIRYSYIEQ